MPTDTKTAGWRARSGRQSNFFRLDNNPTREDG